MQHRYRVYLDIERLPAIEKSLRDYLLSDEADHLPPPLPCISRPRQPAQLPDREMAAGEPGDSFVVLPALSATPVSAGTRQVKGSRQWPVM